MDIQNYVIMKLCSAYIYTKQIDDKDNKIIQKDYIYYLFNKDKKFIVDRELIDNKEYEWFISLLYKTAHKYVGDTANKNFTVLGDEQIKYNIDNIIQIKEETNIDSMYKYMINHEINLYHNNILNKLVDDKSQEQYVLDNINNMDDIMINLRSNPIYRTLTT